MDRGDIITHQKTQTDYRVKGNILAKIDGSWVGMVSYENQSFETFARFSHDFDGFTVKRKGVK